MGPRERSLGLPGVVHPLHHLILGFISSVQWCAGFGWVALLVVPAIASIPGETRREHVNWAIGLDACHRDVYWQCLKQDRTWVPSHLAEVGHLRVMGWLCCEVIQKPGFLLSYCLTVPRALFSSKWSGELASRSSSSGNMAVCRVNPSALRYSLQVGWISSASTARARNESDLAAREAGMGPAEHWGCCCCRGKEVGRVGEQPAVP